MQHLRHITDPATGRRYPIPAGGATDGDGGNGDDGSKAGTTTTPEPKGGDDGKGADKTFSQADVDRIVQDRLARTKAQFADYDELKAKATANESAQDKAVREAREAARNETLTEIGTARLEDRIQVAAAKKLNDPKDAVRLLDVDGLDPYDDKLDAELDRRITKLVEDKPYLAADGRPSGSGDAGSKRTGGKVTAGDDMNARIRRAAGRQ